MNTINLDTVRDQVTTHLRFLGYEVNRDDKMLFARHPKKSNLVVRVYTEGILVTSIFGCDTAAKRDRPGYLEFINNANQGAGIVRYYAGSDSDLFIEGWYSGDYSQVNFGQFLDLWDTDFEKLTKIAGVEKYLK